MLKEFKNILNKLLVVVAILSLLSIYVPIISITSLAVDEVVSLSTPTNLSWKEDTTATATWDAVENANYYLVNVYVYDDNNNLIGSQETGTSITELDIQQEITFILENKEYNSYHIAFEVKARYMTENTVIESEYSILSDLLDVSKNYAIKYKTPQNVKIDENYNISWDVIDNVDYYAMYGKIVYNEKIIESWLNYKFVPASEGIIINGRIEYNLEDVISKIYKNSGFKGEIVDISFRVEAIASVNNINYIDSEISNYSNEVEYKNNKIIIYETPQNVKMDENYNISWDVIDNVDYYAMYGKIVYNEKIIESWRNYKFVPASEGIIINGRIKYNLEDVISKIYKDSGFKGETVDISFKVEAIASVNNTNYINSEISQYSNSQYYNPNGSTIINTITLSPNKPVIAVGRSLYIGKTINPEDAFYDKINWSSSDNSIVKISNMGQITGIKKGNATITAQINNASQNAQVSVYEIESNVLNTEEAEKVINEANDVIEAVINDGDITNTDIKDKETTISEIEQAAQNGDMFNVDIKYENKTENEYTNIEEEITSKFVGYNIAGGNDIKIAISHTDSNGLENHIANITNLENEVSVKFDMSDNIPELSKTKIREYKLVRLHEGDIEEIKFEINDGIIETSSDKFSDFVLLYKDLDIPTFEVNGTITSYGNDTDDISIQVYEKETEDAIFEEKVKGNNANYKIQNVPAGNYIIKFAKNNHVTREYEIVVNNSDATQDAKICLIGDINADGKVNNKDWNRLYAHINETNILTEYELLCSDTNKDGNVNTKDWNRLYNHINETDKLY